MTAARETMFKALHSAGRLIRDNFHRPKKVQFKNNSRINLVTWVDQAADRLIIKTIRKRFPDHEFLTEESYPELSIIPAGLKPGSMDPSLTPAGDDKCRWIIDPLDGTTNYAHGFPQVGVSIGLEISGQVQLGGVYDPFRDELFWAEKGRGAFLQDKQSTRRLHVSSTRKLTQSLLLTGFPYDRHLNADLYLSYVKAFLVYIQGIRRAGAAALDLCWVACGRVDGYWEWRLKPWDCAAGKIIVEEAGGHLSDFLGKPYSLYGEQTLATNGKIHKEMLAVMRRLGRPRVPFDHGRETGRGRQSRRVR